MWYLHVIDGEAGRIGLSSLLQADDVKADRQELQRSPHTALHALDAQTLEPHLNVQVVIDL